MIWNPIILDGNVNSVSAWNGFVFKIIRSNSS